MKKSTSTILHFLLAVTIFITACDTRPSGPVANNLPTVIPPTLTEISDIPSESLTPVPTIEILNTAEAVESPIPLNGQALSAPTLINTPWENREVFASGLQDQQILNELTEGSVYHLIIQIEETTKLTGQMEMLYTNQETEPLDDLYFHLFANQLGGSIDVSNVSINGQPSDSIIENTALRIPLSAALNPGDQFVVSMDFSTTVPKGESTKYNILAYDDEILALAHFYPMVAAYDDDGWHIEPSPPHGDETYADMSYYLVKVTAPLDQIMIASGIDINSTESENTQTITFAAGPTRDFYLVMSSRFAEASKHVGPVVVNSYAPPEYLPGAEMALDVTVEALKSYSQRFGPYPYTELDVVSTPTLALGIEYPGIFVNALRIYDLDQSSSGIPNAIYLESTTAHEAAHQWFYNLVGNDQLNEPWLDEALTQYATWTYFIDRYGEQNAQGFYDSLEGRWSRDDFADIPIGLPADQYSSSDYGAIVYGRGPIFLHELALTMGQDTFDTFMRNYVDTYRWQIATSEDFQALAEQHCRCDLSELFNEWVYPS